MKGKGKRDENERRDRCRGHEGKEKKIVPPGLASHRERQILIIAAFRGGETISLRRPLFLCSSSITSFTSALCPGSPHANSLKHATRFLPYYDIEPPSSSWLLFPWLLFIIAETARSAVVPVG